MDTISQTERQQFEDLFDCLGLNNMTRLLVEAAKHSEQIWGTKIVQALEPIVRKMNGVLRPEKERTKTWTNRSEALRHWMKTREDLFYCPVWDTWAVGRREHLPVRPAQGDYAAYQWQAVAPGVARQLCDLMQIVGAFMRLDFLNPRESHL